MMYCSAESGISATVYSFGAQTIPIRMSSKTIVMRGWHIDKTTPMGMAKKTNKQTPEEFPMMNLVALQPTDEIRAGIMKSFTAFGRPDSTQTRSDFIQYLTDQNANAACLAAAWIFHRSGVGQLT